MLRKISVLVAVALGAAILAPAAGADQRFTFFGSGYGHGIGMSQYGMLGLSRLEWSPKRILRHYYSGVRLVRRAPPSPRVRVGILQSRSEFVLIAVSGSYKLVLNSGTEVDTVASGSRRIVRITDDQKYEVVRPNGKVVGDRTWGGRNNDLTAKRQSGRIRVQGWGHEVGRGNVAMDISGPANGHLVGVMTPEEYVNGLAEVPSSWPGIALQTQAIAGRTFVYWRLAGPPRSGCSCDILSTTADQYWIGWDKEAASGGGRWVRAVKETKKKVLVHKGSFIYSVYGSSSGGYTEHIRKVWPAAQNLPYLKGVCDPADDVGENPSTTWTYSFSPSDVTSRLRAYTGSIGTVTGFTAYKRGVSGRVTTLKVKGTAGSKEIRGWDVRSALGLKDTRFAVNRNLNITGKIRTAYDRIKCRPGRATSPERSAGGGRFQIFKRGRLYLNASRNRVVWVRGPVLKKYVQLGAHEGSLRLPVRFEKISGGTRGVFQGGTITCTSGCRVGR